MLEAPAFALTSCCMQSRHTDLHASAGPACGATASLIQQYSKASSCTCIGVVLCSQRFPNLSCEHRQRRSTLLLTVPVIWSGCRTAWMPSAWHSLGYACSLNACPSYLHRQQPPRDTRTTGTAQLRLVHMITGQGCCSSDRSGSCNPISGTLADCLVGSSHAVFCKQSSTQLKAPPAMHHPVMCHGV